MQRKALAQLLDCKKSPRRKPLILKGARQVGKTCLMKEFGRLNYEKAFYFSFEREEELFHIFEKNKDPLRIIDQLGTIYNDKIEPEKHLIIFDEIQECPKALNSLKYFNEEANEFHIIAAGSLLGTLLAESMSYPVGKVNLLDIYPMDFEEFLEAVEPSLLNYIEQTSPDEIIEIQHTKLIEHYHNYLIIGGMPECVSCWVNEKNSGIVAEIQKELINLYESDFAKHNKKVNAARILLVFRSLVSQLSKENEKFIYGCVKQGARAREFEESIEWLVSSGIVLRVYDVTKPEHPLKAFEDFLNREKLKKPINTKITKKELSVNDRIKSIRTLLDKKNKLKFIDLFDNYTKPYIVVTFLSILEMTKNEEIKIKQENNFGEIILEKM